MKFNKVSLAIIIASGVLMGCEISNDVEAPVTMPNGNVVGSVDNEPDFVEDIPDIYEGADAISVSSIDGGLQNALLDYGTNIEKEYGYYGEDGRYESRFKFDGDYTSTKVEQLENGNVRVLFKKDGDSSEAYNALFSGDVRDGDRDYHSTYGVWQSGMINDNGDFVAEGTPFVVDYSSDEINDYRNEGDSGSAVFSGNTMAIKTENGEQKAMTGSASLTVDVDAGTSSLDLDFTGWKKLYLDNKGNIRVNAKEVDGRGNFDYTLVPSGWKDVEEYHDGDEDSEAWTEYGYNREFDSAVGKYSADFKDGKDNHDVSVVGGFTADETDGEGILGHFTEYNY